MYINPHIKNTQRVFPLQGRSNYSRYDMNENPEGLPEDFVTSILKEITPEFLSTYPEPNKFLEKYADYIGMDFKNVLATNGSDMAIRYLLETFGEPGKDVITVSPSFEMYWVNCSILGLTHVPISYEPDLTFDTDKIIRAITADTRVVVLLNPNNPVGNAFSEKDVRSIVDKADNEGAVVIIDEAYHYFYEISFLGLINEYNNVVILRTFSKLFSLAALRLGVIISNPTIINYIKNAKLTFDVNSIALLFGERILDRQDIISGLVNSEIAGKAYTLKQLSKAGYSTRECKGNFIFVKTKNDPHLVQQELANKKKVLVKSFGNNMLRDYLRISVGSVNAMEKLINALIEVDSSLIISNKNRLGDHK